MEEPDLGKELGNILNACNLLLTWIGWNGFENQILPQGMRAAICDRACGMIMLMVQAVLVTLAAVYVFIGMSDVILWNSILLKQK